MIIKDSLPSPFPFVCVVFLPWCISLSAHSWTLLCAPRSQAWPPHWLTDWRQHKEESCPAYRKSWGQVHSFGRRCSCGKSPQNQQMQSHRRGSLIARLISSLSCLILCVQHRKKARKQPASGQIIQTSPSLQDRRSYQLCHCDPYRRRLRKSTRNLLNTEGNGHRWSILQESSRIPPYCNKGFHKDYQRNVNTNIISSSTAVAIAHCCCCTHELILLSFRRDNEVFFCAHLLPCAVSSIANCLTREGIDTTEI